jgi:predicted Zn-dependent protease
LFNSRILIKRSAYLLEKATVRAKFKAVRALVLAFYLLSFNSTSVIADSCASCLEKPPSERPLPKTLLASLPAASAYPQYRSSSGTIHWLKEQMPLKVYVSHGTTLDKIIDDSSGVPVCNVGNLAHWPDLAAKVLENRGELENQPIAEGFSPEHYDAAKQGISSWKRFEKEGILAFEFTNDPADADIYVFWVNHFVGNNGMALFANDIRGYTAKRSFWLKDIQAGKQPPFKPVVIVLRTTDAVGRPMAFVNMKASAAHEFGHALGIEGHSTNPHDLMSVYYGNGTVSNNDAATIRYLYRLVPDLVP